MNRRKKSGIEDDEQPEKMKLASDIIPKGLNQSTGKVRNILVVL